MEALGRYYTENIVSTLLIKSIYARNPNVIIDLGIGEGALTKAAHKKWSQAKFYAIDIDKKQILVTQKELPFVKIKAANGTNSNYLSKLEITYGSVDVAVCNPPYIKIKKSRRYNRLFKKAELNNCHKLKYYTSDLIFLAHNLTMLKSGGILGIILPDGLLTSHDFRLLREDLLSNHTVKSVIQLPDKIFKKTEARTHILIIQKGSKSEQKKVELSLTNRQGESIDSLKIDKSDLVKRMDFTYHKWKIAQKESSKTLGSLNAEIRRGSCSYKELREIDRNYFHTTDFKGKTSHYFTKDTYDDSKVVASKGDILVARVGKRCIGRVTIIRRGNIILSDCVYRIRVEKEYQEQVLNALLSDNGQNWMSKMSHGVCAQVISKKDLICFPLTFPD